MPDQYPDGNPKTIFGMAKPSLAAVPQIALFHLGAAMAFGAHKYDRFNWRDNKVTVSVYTDAIARHLAAYIDGEDHAPDSRATHLGHIMASCAILLDAAACGKLNDDRIRGPSVEFLHDPDAGALPLWAPKVETAVDPEQSEREMRMEEFIRHG